MDASPTHTAQPRLESSRSPGTAESRTGSAGSRCWDHPLPWIPTSYVSVQDTMARTMQTATDPNYKSEGSGGQTPEGETSGQGDQAALERSPPHAPPHAPSTPADSFLEECNQGGDKAVSAPLESK